MRKIMIMGTGAQGSTIAKRAQEEPAVEEIICADYDTRAYFLEEAAKLDITVDQYIERRQVPQRQSP